MGGTAATGAGIVTDLFGIGDDESNRTTKEYNKTTNTSQNQLGAQDTASQAAQATAENQYGSLNNQLNSFSQNAQGNSQDIDALFKQALTKYAAGSGNPTPDQLQQATSYVDQTFTAPAQTQYNRFLDQAQSQIANRAAQLGRSSTDVGYQREFASQAGNAAEDLANQRGSLIGQRADYLTNQLPQNQLSALYQGSSYFNQPVNQAFNNRLSLLNAATGQQNLGLSSQVARGTQTNTSDQAGSQILPDAALSTKLYNAGSAWNQNGAAVTSQVGSWYKMGAGG